MFDPEHEKEWVKYLEARKQLDQAAKTQSKPLEEIIAERNKLDTWKEALERKDDDLDRGGIIHSA